MQEHAWTAARGRQGQDGTPARAPYGSVERTGAGCPTVLVVASVASRNSRTYARTRGPRGQSSGRRAAGGDGSASTTRSLWFSTRPAGLLQLLDRRSRSIDRVPVRAAATTDTYSYCTRSTAVRACCGRHRNSGQENDVSGPEDTHGASSVPSFNEAAAGTAIKSRDSLHTYMRNSLQLLTMALGRSVPVPGLLLFIWTCRGKTDHRIDSDVHA